MNPTCLSAETWGADLHFVSSLGSLVRHSEWMEEAASLEDVVICIAVRYTSICLTKWTLESFAVSSDNFIFACRGMMAERYLSRNLTSKATCRSIDS